MHNYILVGKATETVWSISQIHWPDLKLVNLVKPKQNFDDYILINYQKGKI